MEEEIKEKPAKKTRGFDEFSAVKIISDSRGVGIEGTRITVKSGALGLKRLSALDFLVNHCKRRVTWVKG